MSQQNQFKSNRVPNALDEIKLRLSGEPINGSKRRPSLKVATSKNNIHMTVFTNVEGDQDGGKIAAQMDSVAFFMFLNTLDNILKSPQPIKRSIPNLNYKFYQGKRSDTPQLISTIILEKESDGSTYISIVNNRASPAKFYFMPSDFHNLLNENGQPVTRAEMTKVYGAAWRELIAALAGNVLAANYVAPEPRDNNGGGNWGNKGGGNYGGGYNNGGGNRNYGNKQGGNQGGFGNASPNAQEEGMPDWGNDSGDDGFPM